MNIRNLLMGINTILLLSMFGCSIFTLEHSNPNDPMNIDELGEQLYPDYVKLYAKQKVAGYLSSSNPSDTYYYKFRGLDNLKIDFDNNSSDYDYDYYLSVKDHNENTVYSYSEYYDKTVSIDKADFNGDYMVITINRGQYSTMIYEIEVKGY